jgi:hypothetical protein
MGQLEFLKLVVQILEQAGFRYMIVGSYASGYWGEPRTTYDVDIVISLSLGDVGQLESLFPENDFYVSIPAALDAVRQGGQFNVIHPDSGNKVDFMIGKTTPWERQQLTRRKLVEFDEGFHCYVGAPEDIILSKLLYYQEGQSQKHLRDIAGMLKVSQEQIDRSYIADWAAKLGVLEIWQSLLDRLTPGPEKSG